MTTPRLLVTSALAAALVMIGMPQAEAQGLRDRIQRQVEERAQEQVEEALGAGEEAVDAGAAADPAAPAPGAGPGEGLWLNYDFVPGARVIFWEDFSGERVGDFPRRFELLRGNMEVARLDGAHWLRSSTDGRFAIALPERLPQRFTLEFDYRGGRGPGTIYFTEEERSRPAVRFYYYRGGLAGGGTDAMGRLETSDRNRFRTVRVMADGNYVKVYLDETRVANVPNADLGRSNRLVFALAASASNPVMLGNVRVAAGGRALYEALMADGRVVTRGILFDSGRDRIRPESTPVLEEIGRMLSEHRDLRLLIEGHTDNVGDAAANQALSARRAEAVRSYLLARHGVEPGRLESVGLGETRPATSNDTPEGRQNNRRVELVRIGAAIEPGDQFRTGQDGRTPGN